MTEETEAAGVVEIDVPSCLVCAGLLQRLPSASHPDPLVSAWWCPSCRSWREPIWLPPFRCPRCSATSHNAEDARQGYCGWCHDWTREGS